MLKMFVNLKNKNIYDIKTLYKARIKMLNSEILNELREAYKDITSEKSWVKTLLLCVFGGYLGLHRFYTCKNKSAIIQLLLSLSVIGLPIITMWIIYDFFQILYNNFTDFENKRLDKNITRQSVTLLTFFFGHLGFCDFYIQNYKKGLIKLLLFISYFGSFISIIWNLVDLYLICFSENNINKYSKLKNNFNTKKCLLLSILYSFGVVIVCCLYFSQTQYFNSDYSITMFINNAWIDFVTFIKYIIKCVLKFIFYCLCGIFAIAIIIGNISDSSKTTKATQKEKSNNKFRYAIVSYQYEGQIYSFKINDMYASNVDKTIWITDSKGFNSQAKFLNITKISFTDYSRSTLPDYRLSRNFYRK